MSDLLHSGTQEPERDDVLTVFDPFASGEFQHLHLVEAWDRLEVKAVDAIDGRDLCRLDPAFNHAPLAVDEFQLDEAQEELDMIAPLGCTQPSLLVVFPQEGRQLQLLQLMICGTSVGRKEPLRLPGSLEPPRDLLGSMLCLCADCVHQI